MKVSQFAAGQFTDEVPSSGCIPFAHLNAAKKCAALAYLAVNVFEDTKVGAVKTGIGVVTTQWQLRASERNRLWRVMRQGSAPTSSAHRND